MPTTLWYAARKALGLCGRCGQARPAPGLALCEPCLTQQRQRRQDEQAAGVCQRCRHRRPAVPGFTSCAGCLLITSQEQVAYQLARLALAHRAAAAEPDEGQYLGCCGAWVKITGIPFQTPCCHRTYFVDLAAAQAPPCASTMPQGSGRYARE